MCMFAHERIEYVVQFSQQCAHQYKLNECPRSLKDPMYFGLYLKFLMKQLGVKLLKKQLEVISIGF